MTEGLDSDFPVIRKIYPKLKEEYKANKIRVSDRHFISSDSRERDFIPDELILEDKNQKSVVKVYYKKDSRFLLSLEQNKFVILDKNTKERLPINVKLVPLYSYAKKLYKGVPLDEFVNVVGLDRVSIIPFDSCDHWTCGLQCKFCGANPNRIKLMKIKPNVFEIKTKFNGDYKAWWSHYQDDMREKISKSFSALLKDNIKPHFHFAVISGNLLDLDFEWEIIFDLLDAIKSKIDLSKIDSYFNLMPPFDFKKNRKGV